MVTPDNTSRRLRLVDADPEDRDHATAEDLAATDEGLTARQAAAFAALVAEVNQAAITYTLE